VAIELRIGRPRHERDEEEKGISLRDLSRALKQASDDSVLLDVHLAGEDTLGLLDRLRLAGIPVALVTGSADPELYRHRADAVVPKPFDPQELVDVARRLARVDA
jgi:CheY-like chemotaxis protein